MPGCQGDGKSWGVDRIAPLQAESGRSPRGAVRPVASPSDESSRSPGARAGRCRTHPDLDHHWQYRADRPAPSLREGPGEDGRTVLAEMADTSGA